MKESVIVWAAIQMIIDVAFFVALIRMGAFN